MSNIPAPPKAQTVMVNSDTDTHLQATIETLLAHALKRSASDIHIEPRERFGLVRYRIGGQLHGVHKLPLKTLPDIYRYIKTVANLDSQEKDRAQTGRFSTDINGQQLTIQVNTLAVLDGEKIVLHLQTQSVHPPSLADIGFWGSNAERLHMALTAPQGLIVVSGLRQSGKTTTLYSMLQAINRPTISAAAIDDSRTYRLENVNQTYANTTPGTSYDDCLRATLSQDPNVILISDLPDKRTVTDAVLAAANGHLVLAGTYAPNTATSLAHLRAFCSEPLVLPMVAQAVICQQLVRTLCMSCRESYTPGPDETSLITTTFGLNGTVSTWQRIYELDQKAQHEGLGKGNPCITTPVGPTHLWRAAPAGCEECAYTGYGGTTTVNEVLTVTDTVRTGILDTSTLAAIRQHIAREGQLIPMSIDGLIKSLRGLTTLAEVIRVVRPSNS